MAQHYMTALSASALKTKDSKASHSKRFTFFENRRAAKWHQGIALLTDHWTIRPVTTAGRAGSLFPYSETQYLTKEFLSRLKSQEDTDRRLLELIHHHGSKEIAFAACASYLSLETVQNFLDHEFEISSDKASTIEPYLQAFVAAAEYKSVDFTQSDRRFATILVAVAGDPSAIQSSTLHMLISTWRAGPPSDSGLRSRAVSLTATVFHNAKLALELHRSRDEWEVAQEYRAPLLQLEDVVKPAGPTFQGCVGAFFPRWRCWARWSPDGFAVGVPRLQHRVQHAGFRCLKALGGPDIVEGEECAATAWRGLIRRKLLVPWLEAKGFKIGVGLICGDTEGLLTEFMEQLRTVVGLAFADGELSIRILAMYIEREGLDAGTLTAWEEARMLLIAPMPMFMEHIRDPPLNYPLVEDFDVLTCKALAALEFSICASTRQAVLLELAHCVNLACNQLDTDLRVSMTLLSLNYEWTKPALRLWQLREAVAKAIWLHGCVKKDVLTASLKQPPARDLQVLRELHTRMHTLNNHTYLNAANDYVHSYVLDGNVSGAPLFRAVHTLWAKTPMTTLRDTSITIATMDTLSTDIRCSCIDALAELEPSTVDKLHDRLLQIQAKVTAAYMDFTEVVVSLNGLLGPHICWVGLLWALLKSDAIFIDQSAFTDRGQKAYSLWIQQLHSLFGGKLSLSADTHACLRELQSLGPVLQTLEAIDGSKPVVHRLLTTIDRERKKHHLKLLTKIHAETRIDRRASMLILLLSLDGSNAAKICTAIFASASLSDADFKTCNAFLTLGRKNKDLAAARLAVWLNMSEFSPMLKAVLIDVGEVLGLKESRKAWKAAQKSYEKKVLDLLIRARKLEGTRMQLMRGIRGQEVEVMMEELKLEVPEGVSAVVAELPDELVDFVEVVSEDVLEIVFPLSGLHGLMKTALGVEGTETVVVSLRVFGGGVVDGFCVHVEKPDAAVADGWKEHTWVEVGKDGGKPPRLFECRGRQTRLEFVVARAVWRQLQEDGEADQIPALYGRVKEVIQNGANSCLVCAKDVGARLHRATACGSSVCSLTLSTLDFNLLAEPIRHEPRVFDLLLSSAHAVASAGKTIDTLLPSLPAVWNDAAKLLALLNAFPATDTLATAIDTRTPLRLLSRNADLLASYLCTASRTNIIAATGHWRIPNMPGIHQFLVVDNAPEIEAGFAKHNHLQPRMVLFHGTSMDRLYAILAQGLRVLSNTPLMKHGAVSGAGIYFSTDTSIPASYAGASAAEPASAFFKNGRRDFEGVQVLLGCEHAGPATKGGVFLVTDPTKVVVRYVFLIPKGVGWPMSKDVVAPMVSTFYSLRASAASGKG